MQKEYPYRCLVSDMPVWRAECEGAGVYAFGYSHVYSEPPALIPPLTMQRGSGAPLTRYPLKRSHQIESNFLGSTTPRMPRLTQNDDRPLEPVHLIDGDPDTCWASRTQMARDCEPTWIRLDLAAEATIRRLVLRKRKSDIARAMPGSMPLSPGACEVGRAMVDEVELRVSVDGAKWISILQCVTADAPDKLDFSFDFEPVRAKMVLVIGRGYRKMENLLCCFSIACLEVYDEGGNNLALVSRGAGIAVSSTQVSLGQEIETHRWLWPVQHDMGLKWSRIGYHDDPINWHWVEREKGVLSVDPVADAAITELTQNGIQVVMCLNFGNRLYQADPARHLPQLWEWYYENPQPPKTDEALTAWARYVRFMVEKYKDRVRYFEIWNEWNIPIYWGDAPDLDLFLRITGIAIPIIRELAPEARVMLGSYAGFPRMSHLSGAEREAFEQGDWLLRAIKAYGPKVDAIGYHPFYALDPDGATFRKYEADVLALMEYGARCGFHGEYMASEFNIAANYPESDEGDWWGKNPTTEMQKAKYCARVAALHTSLNVGSFFCETWSNSYPMDLSLMRRMFPSYPIMPLQPSAGYYVTRNMSTLLEGLSASDARIDVSGDREGVECHAMEGAGCVTAAFWTSGRAKDVSDIRYVDLSFPGEFRAATAFDAVSGMSQALAIRFVDGRTIVPDCAVTDYPILVKLVQ